MNESPANFDSDSSATRKRPSPAIEAEIHQLTDALVDRNITEQQQKRLEEIVTADAGAAEIYLEIMYEWASLPNYIAAGIGDVQAKKTTADPPLLQMNETMILPAVVGIDEQDEDPPVTLPAYPQVAPRPRRMYWWVSTAAAVVVLASTLFVTLHHANKIKVSVAPAVVAQAAVEEPAATITAIAAADPNKRIDFSIGDHLFAGQSLQTDNGDIELTFASGAVVIVKSPSRFDIVDQNAIALADGELSAHVPLAAHGFRATAPGLLAVDHGTDFGVRTVNQNAASEVHIFGGVVGVAGTDAQGHSTSDVILAVTGHAYRHDATDLAAPTAVKFAPQSFHRDIDDVRRPIKLYNTGENLPAAAADPNWIIESAPGELKWKPQPAAVISNPAYPTEPNTADGKWISTDAAGPHLPAGLYVFRTNVNLSGIKLSTVRLQALVTADDGLENILINGVSAGLRISHVAEIPDYRHSTLEIPSKFWRDGLNQIDVVVRNENAIDGAATQMGLQLRWIGSGCNVVRR